VRYSSKSFSCVCGFALLVICVVPSTRRVIHRAALRPAQVYVGEATVLDTISVLRGIKAKYEEHHGVRIHDSALLAAAELSNRYINGRFLPDKACTPCPRDCSVTAVTAAPPRRPSTSWTRRAPTCACSSTRRRRCAHARARALPARARAPSRDCVLTGRWRRSYRASDMVSFRGLLR
jgi:hypothetical protein